LDYGANIYSSNDYALRWSAENKHLDVVKLLLKRKTNKEIIKHRDIYQTKKHKLFDKNILGIIFWV
jgi:hypothetical protein